LHFLATNGGRNDVDKKVLQALVDTLCQLCTPLLNHRNERGLINGAAHCSIVRQRHSCDSSAGCRRRIHFYFYF